MRVNLDYTYGNLYVRQCLAPRGVQLANEINAWWFIMCYYNIYYNGTILPYLLKININNISTALTRAICNAVLTVFSAQYFGTHYTLIDGPSFHFMGFLTQAIFVMHNLCSINDSTHEYPWFERLFTNPCTEHHDNKSTFFRLYYITFLQYSPIRMAIQIIPIGS